MPVSAMMDAAATNAPMSQINFIEFVVAPLYATFTRLFPEARELVARLVENRVHFQRALERELDGDAHPELSATRASPEHVTAAERCFAQSGGARAARAGAGKAFAEREADKRATRARFKALVEKHAFEASVAADASRDDASRTTPPVSAFAEHTAFEALMRDAPRNARLARLPPSPRADPPAEEKKTPPGLEPARVAAPGLGPGANAGRALLAAAAAGVRDAALAAGASAKRRRRPSGKADAEKSARSPTTTT